MTSQFPGHPTAPAPSGCALIIPGPPKSRYLLTLTCHLIFILTPTILNSTEKSSPSSSSLFDHTNHVFGGPPVQFDSQNTCITYDAVNAAFISARDRVGLPPVRGKFTTHDVGNLGTVIHEASR